MSWCHPVVLFLSLSLASSAAPAAQLRGSSSFAETQPRADSTYAFVGVNVIPMDREVVLGDQTVIVRGERIIQVGPRLSVAVPRDAHRIEGKGRYLVPGLTDMHVHFSRPEQQGDLALYLANGITTIRNLNGFPAILEWREEVERGTRIAPTIVSSGPTVRELSDSAHAERIVAEHRLAGYDAIKVYSGVAADPYRVLMRSAKAAGITVVGHVPVQVGLAGAVRAGQRTLEHAEDLFQTHFESKMDSSRMDALVRIVAKSDVCVTPTLVVFSKVVQHLQQFPDLTQLMATPELAYVDPARRSAWSPENNSYVRRGRSAPERVPEFAVRVVEQFEFMKRIVAALHAAKVPILAGSDANVPFTIPGFSLLEELQFLVRDAGLSPHDALRAATVTPAECMGKAEDVGTIAAGRRADLVLLEADPLADIANLKKRVGVMARGRWLTEAVLQQRMAARTAG